MATLGIIEEIIFTFQLSSFLAGKQSKLEFIHLYGTMWLPNTICVLLFCVRSQIPLGTGAVPTSFRYKLCFGFPRRRKKQNLLPDTELWCYMFQSWETRVCLMAAADFTRPPQLLWLRKCFCTTVIHFFVLRWEIGTLSGMTRASGSAEWLDAHLVHFCLAMERWWNGGNSEAGFWKEPIHTIVG